MTGLKKLGIKLDAQLLSNIESYNVVKIHKGVGNVLDKIFTAMEEQDFDIPAELMELKQWLRFKGNSDREHGNYKMWKGIDEKEQAVFKRGE